MREIEVQPPLNQPVMSYRQALRYWLIVCAFTVFACIFVFDYLRGRAQAETGAVWLIVILNLAGHALLLPVVIRARRWEEQNRRNILAALKKADPAATAQRP